jgi:subtilisin family serine protease
MSGSPARTQEVGDSFIQLSALPELPSHSLAATDAKARLVASGWPAQIDRAWALDGSSGAGVRVCVLDSGIDGDHPDVGAIERAVAIVPGPDGYAQVVEDEAGDVFGHGTGCAGIIRALAPDASISSVRVLGADNKGSGAAILAGLRWAIAERYDVVNLSLASTSERTRSFLYGLADSAYFHGSVLVASAHNMGLESWPWQFASVISVGSHDGDDPLELFANTNPPVEFFARGVGIRVPWIGGGHMTVSGNSFAAAHVSALCALILAKHPELTAFEVKSALHLIASNVAVAAR